MHKTEGLDECYFLLPSTLLVLGVFFPLSSCLCLLSSHSYLDSVSDSAFLNLA